MKLQDFIKAGSEEGKEKHVPYIKVSECSTCGELSVVIKVGETIFHPSTPEHFIETIQVFGVNNENKIIHLTTFNLGRENSVPYVKTHVKKGTFKSIIATSLCNIHGLWENSVDL